jgi:chitin disaccharide deacetylase
LEGLRQFKTAHNGCYDDSVCSTTERSKLAKKLIIAADDFGLTHRVNEAIAIACRDGIVTSASLMVTGAGFESAVDTARSEPNLDIGLHLNLTEGSPVANPSTVPTLADSRGFLYKHPLKLAASLFQRTVSLNDLEREIRAQIEKALNSSLWVTHIDGHKHVHLLPAVFRIIRRVAPDYGIFALRSAHERIPRVVSMLARQKSSWRQVLKQCAAAKLISASSVVAQSGKKQSEFVTPNRFYGIAQTGFLDLASFADIVHDVNDGNHELMCHPGFVDDDLKMAPTRLRAQRERELELLTGPEVRRVLEQAGVALISYRNLVEDYGNRRPNPVLRRYSAL